MEIPQFPAGQYVSPGDYDEPTRTRLIEQLEGVPQRARESIAGLKDSQLETKYRNWTIRQIIHHLADSHIHCYVRIKWTLTEDTPNIKSYDESRWSEVIDARTIPLECSLQILDGIHLRWAQLLRCLNADQMQRGFFHPELDRVVTLAETLPNYVWHAEHHLGQIAWLREQNDW